MRRRGSLAAIVLWAVYAVLGCTGANVRAQGSASKALKIRDVHVAADGQTLSFMWAGLSGRHYSLQTASNLVDGVWTRETGGLFVSGLDAACELTNHASAVSAFYRLRERHPLAEVTNLANALVAYRQTYGEFPVGLISYDTVRDIEYTVTGIEAASNLVHMLAGSNINGLNPSNVVFLVLPPDALTPGGYYVDPWGGPYKYMCDYDGNGSTYVVFTSFFGMTNLDSAAAVWSRGPDGSDWLINQADDIRSW